MFVKYMEFVYGQVVLTTRECNWKMPLPFRRKVAINKQ